MRVLLVSNYFQDQQHKRPACEEREQCYGPVVVVTGSLPPIDEVFKVFELCFEFVHGFPLVAEFLFCCPCREIIATIDGCLADFSLGWPFTFSHELVER